MLALWAARLPVRLMLEVFAAEAVSWSETASLASPMRSLICVPTELLSSSDVPVPRMLGRGTPKLRRSLRLGSASALVVMASPTTLLLVFIVLARLLVLLSTRLRSRCRLCSWG